MPLIDSIIGQLTGTFKLVSGKDVDINSATDGISTPITLHNDDLFLVDDGAAGTQASTKKITTSILKTYMEAQLASMTNTITAAGFTTTGTITMPEYTDDTAIGITKIQDSGTTFVDNDTSIMTAAAIADKIEAYSYSTTTGTVTSVSGGTGLTSTGGSTPSLSVDASQTGITAIGTIATGTWEATDVAIAHGGTGSSNAADACSALGVGTEDSPVFASLQIDKDISSTIGAVLTGILVDFDKTGTSVSTNTLTGVKIDIDNTTATDGTNVMYGIYNTPTLTHADAAGTANVTGLYQLVTGGANGTSGAWGITQRVTGGDQNIGLNQTVEDGGIDIKCMSSADTADYFSIATSTNGETTLTTVDSDAAVAHLNIEADGHVEFDGCGVGYAKVTEAFSTSDFIGDANDSTDVDFRQGNKVELTLTDDISGSSEFINLIFPATSGNFLLVLIQGATSCTVASAGWVARAFDESLCDNLLGANGTDGAVRWAGGTSPTLTTTQYKSDIISIYWDAHYQTACATVTHNF